MTDTKFKKGMIPWNRKEDSMVEAKCLFCNSIFTFNQYRVKKGRKKFCSASCRSKHTAAAMFAAPEVRFWNNIEKTDDCWIWKGKSKQNCGYGVFSVNDRLVRAHRFSYEHHKGTIPAGLNVLHSCDNPSCVNPNHLFLGTQKDNAQDMLTKGRDSHGEKHSKILKIVSLKGEKHPNCRFSDKDVVEMRNLYENEKWSQERIAQKFGTYHQVISGIVTYKSRKRVINY